MAITMAEISHLRKMSGAGMMDCKQALEAASGDFDKAMEVIRKKGQAVAAKRSDREASEGCVLASAEGEFAAIVALKCETDFVAKNEQFVALTKDILTVANTTKPASLDELKAAHMSDGRTVEEHITDRIGVTGEKMELGFYEYLSGASTISYIHPGNKLATIVAFNQPIDYQTAREMAMQVAAMNPIAVSPEDVPQTTIDKEQDIARSKAIQEGKPDRIIDIIVQSSLQMFFKDNTLLKQNYIKDSKISVEQYLQQKDKQLVVTAFRRVTLNME